MCQPGDNIPTQYQVSTLKKKKHFSLRSVFAQFQWTFQATSPRDFFRSKLHKMGREAKWQKETRPMSQGDLQ